MFAVAEMLEHCPPAEPFAEEPLGELTDLDGEPFSIAKEDGAFVVTGRAMDRLVDSVNFDNEESLNYFHRSLRAAWCVIDALREQGAQEGDSVVVGGMEFDFVE